MRILQIIQRNQWRGAEVFATQLADHLLEKGMEVKIGALYDNRLSEPLSANVLALGAGKISKWVDFNGWKSMAQLVRTFKPDIIQANAGDTLLYVVMSKIVFRWKTPIIYRNASMVSSYLSGRWSKYMYGVFLRKVSGVASVSEITATDLIGLFPFLSDRTTVLPVGVNLDDFRGCTPVASPHEVHLLHIGGFTFEKNHEGVLRIFKQLSLPNAVLHLVGDGPLRPLIEERVKEMGLSSRVVFHGSIPRPFKKLGFASVLLLPSVIEGTPAVIMEAFAAHIPVVAYNVGAVSSLIEDNVTGYLVESRNESSFVEKVRLCLSQSNDSILASAHELVVNGYNNEQIANAFVRLYEKVLVRH